jgi:hypothetical protein
VGVADAEGSGVAGSVLVAVGASVDDGIGGDGVAVPLVGLTVGGVGDVDVALGVGFFVFFVRVGCGVGVLLSVCADPADPPGWVTVTWGGGRTSR